MTMTTTIMNHLSDFTSHGLNDLSKAVLMDRVDTKYIIPLGELDDLLVQLKAHCTILKIDERCISHYKNNYFDSVDLQYYRDHHNGALNRYKVRCRTYVEQDKSFLEVKFKNNKKRTLKKRVRVDQNNIHSLVKENEFLQRCGIENGQRLISVQECDYYRVAFANEASGERLTIDFNLSYLDPENQQTIQLDNMAIIELKQNIFNRNSQLYKVLRSKRLRHCKFSKYCIGLSLLRSKIIKTNRFKETLLKVKKLTTQSALFAEGKIY